MTSFGFDCVSQFISSSLKIVPKWYGPAVWACGMALRYGPAVWPCGMALRPSLWSGMSSRD